jgi:uncharacterized repeat protein (TIGR01451 family)
MALLSVANAPGFGLFAASREPGAAPRAGLPIRFEPSGASEYRSHGGHPAVVLKPGAIAIGGASGSIVMTFPGSRSVAPTADDGEPSIANYFLGSNPRNWRTNIPAYSRVRYRSLYPGIDLVFYGSAGRIEYDFAVSPGADPSRIQIALVGAERIALTAQGDLAVTADGADIAFLKPRIYQDSRDGRHTVAGRYRLANGTVSFEVGRYDHGLPAIIDPALTYATYFGGAGDETAHAVATDGYGNMYIAGFTSSKNLLTTTGAVAGQFGGGPADCFVAKFSPSGALLYSTYLGGSGDEEAWGLAVDPQGDAYITGYTASQDFPVTASAYIDKLPGASNAFVAKLNPAGTALLYSSYLGGSGSDTGYGVAVDGSGDIFVTGSTSSTDFPVSTGSYRTTYAGGGADAFVTAFKASGSSLIYSTYLGGSDEDLAFAIALDAMGDAYVAGATLSGDFPNLPRAIQAAENGGYDGFVTALNASGTALIYSTFLGGSSDDYAFGVAVDSAGNAYVTGYTVSTDFPHTPGVLQPANGGGYDAFVSKISPSGTALVYSTYVGGSGDDYAFPIAVDSGGNAYISGVTGSNDFPFTTDAAQSSLAGQYDAFVAVLNSDASAEWYATYLGGTDLIGSAAQTGYGMALAPAGQFIAAGYTNSPGFPVTGGAFQPALAGSTDAFMAAFSALTLPVLSIASTHDGSLTQGQAGAAYAVTVSNSAAAGPTSGTVTVTDTLPAGLTATAIGGDGWACALATLTCTRRDALDPGDSYPEIALTVTVANDAPSSLTNQVSVSGGSAPPAGSSDPTTVILVPALSITKTHNGNFTQRQTGATYSVTVSNGPAAAPTSSPVTVTDTLPTGLTATAIGGTGWGCTLTTLTCTRSDSLPAGEGYSPITVTVTVAGNALATLTNQASVSLGGPVLASASDVTAIVRFNACDVNGDGSITVADVQMMIGEALGAMPPVYDLNRDGVVNVADVQTVIDAVLNLGCSAT